MVLHLIKLSVGSESVDSLRAWQTHRLETTGKLYHITRQTPRRGAEILAGDGSIYWVVKGLISARQAITGFEATHDDTGRPACAILLAPRLIATDPTPHRAFQGWRYLSPDKAPRDLAARRSDPLPAPMAAELRRLGLL